MISMSVIIPVYNAVLYLEKCIRSIQKQTIENMEILCVEDGSTDKSLIVLSEFQREDPRIKIICQENYGAAAARNHALREAKGEYIAFVDADDFLIDPMALELMFNAAKREKMQIVGAFRSIEKEGRIVQMDFHRGNVHDLKNGNKILYRDYQYDYHFQNYIYKRRFLEENQIIFPDYRRFQDPPFFVKAMIAASEFWVVPVEYYGYYCGHENYKYTKQKIMDIICGITDILELSCQENLHRLHVTAVDRLNRSFYEEIIEQCLNNDAGIINLLWKANNTVQWEWVSACYGRTQTMLKVLEFVSEGRKTDDCIQRMIANKHKYGFAFPFDEIKSGRKIALYAAGNVGIAYYEQLYDNPEYELVLWVDKNWQKYEMVGEMAIQPVEKILCYDFDYIVVALEEREAAKSVIELLIKMKVESHKIIW